VYRRTYKTRVESSESPELLARSNEILSFDNPVSFPIHLELRLFRQQISYSCVVGFLWELPSYQVDSRSEIRRGTHGNFLKFREETIELGCTCPIRSSLERRR